MSATSSQKSNHITLVRNASTQWVQAQNALIDLRREWDALDLANELTEADFVGENTGLTPAEIAAVYTTLTAELALMAQGHITNLMAVKK
jgi:hypothetical protein